MMEGISKQPPIPSSFDSKRHQVRGAEDTDLNAVVSQIESGNFKTALQALSKENVISLKLGPQQDSLLHYASKQGNMTVVKQLVQEYSYSPLACNQRGQTCLHAAASCGQLDVLRYLLQVCTAEDVARASCRGEKKEGKWREEETGSMGGEGEKTASGVCDSDTQVGAKDNRLVDSTASTQSSIVLSSVDNNHNSLLHVCAMHGKLRIAKFLVSETKATILTTNVDGHNPLHLAAKHGHLGILKYLASVANYSSPRDKEGRSALHLAVEEGHTDVARFLVEHKLCDPTDTITKCGYYAAKSSLLHMAAQNGHLEIMMYLVDEVGCNLYQKDGSDNLPLHIAVIHGNLEVVKYLIFQKLLSPLCRGEGGKTVLYLVSHTGHLEILQYFIKQVQIILSHENFTALRLLSAAQIRALVHLKKLLERHMYGEVGFSFGYHVRLARCDLDPSALQFITYQSAASTIKTASRKHGAIKLKRNEHFQGQTPLHSSCIEGHQHNTQYLTEEGNVCTDDYHINPLHVAARSGHMDSVRFLVEEKHANLMSRDCYSNTPLHYAAQEGKLEVVQYILAEHACDAMLQGYCQRTALHFACFHGHLEIVKYLCNVHKVDPSHKDMEHSTPLHLAAMMGHLSIVQFLVEEKRCNLMSANKLNNTPVHVSAMCGHLDVTQYLIRSTGFDPLSVGNKGQTLVHFASAGGHLHLLKLLLKWSQGVLSCCDDLQRTPLHLAAMQGHLNVVKFLAEDMKCNILCHDKNNHTPLHLAAQEDRLNIVKYFISDQSCDLLYKGESSMSALHIACVNGHSNIVKFMMKFAGASLLCFDEQNNTPLHSASLQGSLKNVKCLAKKDHRQLMTRNNYNHTPLHSAAAAGHLDVVKYFVEEKNCVSLLMEENAVTPTHLACLNRRTDVVKYFIDEKNVSPVHTDGNGSTPLHMAAQSGYLPLVKWLYKKQPSSALVVNKSDFSPVITAASFHKWEVVRCFLFETDLQFFHSEIALCTLCWNAVMGNCFDVVQYCGTCSYVDSSGSTKQDILQVECTDPCHFCIVTGGRVTFLFAISLPFHLTCATGNFHLAKYFIEEQCVSPLSTNSEGVSSLHLAAWSGNLELVKYLVEKKGCDVLATDKYSRQPFHYAVFANHLKVVSYFLSEKGCDPLSITEFEDGANSLHLSCLFGHLSMAKYFINELNVDPRCINDRGLTPLHFAVFGNHLTLVKYLVEELHCDPLATNNKLEFSAFHYASMCGHEELIHYFVSERRCDPVLRSVLGRTPIHIASLNGHIKAVQYFVENWNVDILCRDDLKHNSLHLAACNGHIDVLKYLAQKAPHALTQKCNDYTVLHLAAARGHIDVVKFVIEQIEHDPECEGENIDNPIQLACANGHLEVVRYLHEECRASLFCIGIRKFSLLHAAAHFGFLPIVDYLVNKGCDIFQRNSNQNMPVHCAAMSGHLEIVKTLVAHMKDLNVKFSGQWGMTILHCACLGGHLHIVKYICHELKPDISCKDMFQHTALHSASYSGHLQIVEYLTDNGCDAMSRDHTSGTAFHLAIIQGHSEIVKYFVDKNICDPMLRGTLGRTPLHLASLNGHLPLVQLFVEEYKVSCHCYDYKKQTPLHLAAAGGQLEVFMYLIEKGCDPNCTDNQNQTPLHLAAYGGHLDVVKYATEVCHCDVQRKDNNNNIPLHLAAIGGKLHINRYFIMNTTCEPQCKGYSGRIPLHFACERGHLNVVKYYVDELHVSPSYADNDGNTPLHLAAITEQMHIMEYLVEEKQCDIMVTNKHQRIPLHEALSRLRWKSVQYLTDEKRFNLREAQGVMQALISIAILNGELSLVDRCCTLCPTNFSVNSSSSTPMQSTKVEFAWRQATINTTSSYQTNKSPSQIRNFLNISFQLPVHMACASGKLSILKCLIKHGMDPDLFHNNYTPLHIAALGGHLSIVKYLVETAKCEMRSSTDEFFYTPLHLAISGKKLEVVKYLILKRACDPMQTVLDGFTCLHSACNVGDIHIVEFLITKCNVSLECTDKQGFTPLHIAALKGHLHVVKYLVEDHKCDPRRKSNDGALALLSASRGGSLSVFRYLLNRREISDPLVTDNMGRAFTHYAASTGQLTIIRYAIDYLKIKLTEDHEGCTPLHFAAIGGNLQVVKALIQHQNDSHYCDHAGRLPLHLASKYGHLELVKYFIETMKCSPSCYDEHNRTPLHLACLNGHVQTAEYLIVTCKVNPDCRDVRKCTPLHFAAHNGKLHVVKYLLNKGCDIASRDKALSMPIHYAAHAGHLNIVKFLIVEKKCDPNTEGDIQVTPLHNATARGHLNVVKFLIEECKLYEGLDKQLLLHFSVWFGHLNLVKYFIREQQCSPMFVNAADRMPLHFACMCGHLHIVKYLILKQYVDISSEDDDGNTPVHLACINGHLNVVVYLLHRYNEVISDLCDDLVCLASKHGHLEIIRFVMEKLSPTVNIKQSLDIAHGNGHTEIVRYFFSKGYGSNVVQPSHYARPPILPRTQVYVIGNPEAGKTTLIKSLQNPSSFTGWLSGLLWSVDEPHPHRETAGIVPTELQTSQLNNVTIFDFAGQTEYYSCNGSFLEGVCYAVVLLTIDISCSEKATKKVFKYWHMFIDSVANRERVIRVVVVGTHRDKLKPEQRRQKIGIIQECMEKNQSQFILYVGCIALDCRNSTSQEFSKLTDMIESCCKMVCLSLELDYNNGSILNVFLKSRFPKATVCSFHNLQKCLERSTAPDLLPLKSHEILCQACDTLHESGYIKLVMLPDATDVWLILKNKHFLDEIHGLLKHPKFPTTKGLGLLSATRLTCFLNEQLRDSDTPSQLAIHYMTTMQYCAKVDDPDIIKVVSQVTSTANEEFYFFPQLVQLERPENVWIISSKFLYKCGWRLKCTDDYGFLHSNLLHILLIYVVLKFGLVPKLHSQGSIETNVGCKLWKNGVRWLDPAGVEVVIEVSGEQNSVVSLLMRCHQRAELQLVALRSFLVKQILQWREKHSPSCTCEEVLIHRHCLTQFPSEQSSEIKMSDVSMAVVWKRPNVLLDEKCIVSSPDYPFLAVNDLVYYDGYVGLGPELLQDLLMEDNQDKVITGRTLEEIAKAVPTTSLVLETVLGMKTSTASDSSAQSPTLLDTLRQWSAETDGKYGTLRNALDQYSLFAGRSSLLSQCLDIYEQTDALSITSKRAIKAVPAKNEGRPRMNDFRWLKGRDRTVQIIKNIAYKWEAIAYSFHLEPPEVNTIKRDSFVDAETACESMLSKWLLGEHRKPVTWSTVVECLRECEFQTLADDLEHILCPEECVGSNSETDKGKHKSHTKSGVDCTQPHLHELKVLKKEHSTIKIIQTVALKWKELATLLQVRPDDVEEIVEETSNEEQACEAVFGWWLCGRHRAPVTWSTVVRCLSECGFQELAQDVAEVLDLQ